MCQNFLNIATRQVSDNIADDGALTTRGVRTARVSLLNTKTEVLVNNRDVGQVRNFFLREVVAAAAAAKVDHSEREQQGDDG